MSYLLRQSVQRVLASKSVRAVLTGCALTLVGIGGCAASTPYNPEGLDSARLTEVSGICQNVLGLSPSERYMSGIWTGVGAGELDTVTNHFRGCVASLSHSLLEAVTTERASEAAQSCEASGLKPGTPDLAMCVLNRSQSATVETAAPPAATTSARYQLTPPATPFYRASGHETVQRENLACAALGLLPGTGAFGGCVNRLNGTFFSIDNPVE